MIRRFSGLWKDGAGSSAIEFAFLGPILLLTMLGIVELGRFYFIRSGLQYAADEAARYVILHTTADSSAISQQVTQNLIAVPSSGVSISSQNQTIGSLSYKQISVSYNFSTVAGNIVGLNNIPITVQSTVPLLP